jgi:hypothetical protein
MAAKRTRYTDVPLSEDTGKSDSPWTSQQCIEELRRVAELDPEKVVSRNYFRVHGRIKESVWNAHFGTFQQFKRSAGIILSRHQHRMELDVAKHAGVDRMREFNAEKIGYEDKYLRPCSHRFQTLVHCTDLHDKEIDPFYRRILMETIGRVQPEKVIIGGDLFDLPEFGKYAVDPREWDVVGRIQFAHGILADIRDEAPNAEIVLVEGNHEYRLLRHLAEASPAMRAVLADLHGFTVPKLLGLDLFGVNYVSRTDLGTFTKKDVHEQIGRNYHVSWDCYLTHHFPEGERMGYPGGHGHHHRHLVSQKFSPVFGSFEWHQLGCGHRREATYCPGEQWGLGFVIAHADVVKKHVLHEYVQIDDHAVVGGRFYERQSDEV